MGYNSIYLNLFTQSFNKNLSFTI